MTTEHLMKWIASQGVVLEAARGDVPNVADYVAGEPVRGSWWGHPKSQEIFRLTRAIRDSEDILVCRLVDGKITFVHRKVWPALVRLADRFPRAALARVTEVHTPDGKHALKQTPFPNWVSAEVLDEAAAMSEAAAEKRLKALAP